MAAVWFETTRAEVDLNATWVPITDVAKWLGHRNINVTHATYGHLVPSSLGRALDVLNAEYFEWSAAA